MPFDRYLQNEDPLELLSYPPYDVSTNTSINSNINTGTISLRNAGINSSTFSNSVQLQIPQFIYNTAPTLAPGGGAEGLPAGMFSNGSLASSWFSNNGFTPKLSEQSLVLTRNMIKQHLNLFCSFYQPPSRRYPSAQDQIAEQQPLHSSSAPLDFHSQPIQTNPSPISLPHHSQSPHGPSMFTNPSTMITPNLPLSPRDLIALGASAGFTAPSPLGLPVYSASGFDILSILARVATRPHPSVVLGPVDMTCSFVVVDVRRYDHPIVYCSPTFCRLTGYEEREVMGRNCRFLQSPHGVVQRGEHRRYTSSEAVSHLKKSLVADKECQTSIINYRKDGGAFINLVTVIPIAGGVSGAPHERDDVVYHVGFQVDLTEQPNAILQKLRDGSYIVDYGLTTPLPPNNPAPRDRKVHIAPTVISKDLKKMLADPKFLRSFSMSTTVPVTNASEKTEAHENNQILNLLLLESTPDFIHVVSLKGSFLYVAPSVRRVLGYEPEELLGKSIAEFCHPADVVPLMRELKESSATGPGVGSASTGAHDGQEPLQYSSTPKTVDLLFRACVKTGGFVWVECRGRLHVEPGKGRKAIILSGRAREMPKFDWAGVVRAGGLHHSVRTARASTNEDGTMGVEVVEVEKEFWGMVSVKGTFLVAGAGVRDVLGWSAEEVIGKAIGSFVAGDEPAPSMLEAVLLRIQTKRGDAPEKCYCRMVRKDGGHVDVQVVLYRSTQQHPMVLRSYQSISPSPLIYQIITIDDISFPPTTMSVGHLVHPPAANVFEELETSRGSSWQYELQQLKFANQRLMEEISSLEAQVQPTQHPHYPQPTSSYPPLAPAQLSRPHQPPSHHLPGPGQDWISPSTGPGLQYHTQPSSLKRSWDSINWVPA